MVPLVPQALLRPTTRLAVVNFPHNPTGFIPSRHDWGRLVAACREASAVLFSDEMYRLMGTCWGLGAEGLRGLGAGGSG